MRGHMLVVSPIVMGFDRHLRGSSSRWAAGASVVNPEIGDRRHGSNGGVQTLVCFRSRSFLEGRAALNEIWPGIHGADGPADPPENVDEVTPEWLTSRLRAIGILQTGRVSSIDVADFGEPGMGGDVHRLLLSYDRQEVAAPDSLVAKFASGDDTVRAMLHSMGFFEREFRFYSEFAQASSVRVPKCYFASMNMRSGMSLLLLEDLSALPRLGRQRGCGVVEAEAVLSALASLHAAWWGNERLRSLPWLTLRGMSANDHIQTVFERYWNVFVDKLNLSPTEEISDVRRLGERYLGQVSAYIYGAGQITLLHNDVHGDNILIDRTQNSVVLLDWQLATFGRGGVDVASLLGASLNIDDRRESWSRLVGVYHQQLVERGVIGYSLQQCEVDCRLGLLPAAARVAAAVGTHPGVDADPGGYWRVVFSRFAAALRELDVAELLAEHFG